MLYQITVRILANVDDDKWPDHQESVVTDGLNEMFRAASTDQDTPWIVDWAYTVDSGNDREITARSDLSLGDYGEGDFLAEPKDSRSLLEQLADEYGSEGLNDDDTGRFLLVEQNVKGSSPPYYLTRHDSPTDAGSYAVNQEYPDGYDIVGLWDLETGQELRPTTHITWE